MFILFRIFVAFALFGSTPYNSFGGDGIVIDGVRVDQKENNVAQQVLNMLDVKVPQDLKLPTNENIVLPSESNNVGTQPPIASGSGLANEPENESRPVFIERYEKPNSVPRGLSIHEFDVDDSSGFYNNDPQQDVDMNKYVNEETKHNPGKSSRVYRDTSSISVIDESGRRNRRKRSDKIDISLTDDDLGGKESNGHMISEYVGNDPFHSANEALNKGYFESAMHYYNLAIKRDQENRDAIFGRAVCYQMLSQHADAIEAYIGMIHSGYNGRDVMNNITISMGAANPKNAILALREIDKMFPNDPTIMAQMGTMYARIKNYNDARRYLMVAMNLDQRNPVYAYNLAIVLDQMNLRRQAIKWYTATLEYANDAQISSINTHQIRGRIRELKVDLK